MIRNLTAMEQPDEDERVTKPANSGIAETLTPLPMSASVTLKSGASKDSWPETPTIAVRVTQAIVLINLIMNL